MNNSVTTLHPSEVQPIKRKNHIGILDLLRGAASISVVCYHYTANNLLAKFESPHLNSIFKHGYLGVEVFFVISGFIIPYSIWDTNYKPSGFFKYLSKRIIRICPPAYVSLLFMLCLYYAAQYLHPEQQNKLSTLSLKEILGNIFFVYGYNNPKLINGVFWTLNIEFQFYLLVGLFFKQLYNTKTQIYFLSLFIGLSVIQFFYTIPDHSPFAYSPLFAMGGLALLYHKQKLILPAFLGILAIFSALSMHSLGPIATILSIATTLSILFVKMSHSFFSLIGKISYSLYLIHIPIGIALDFLFSKIFHPITELQHIQIILLCIILACVFAYIFTNIIERPFLHLARRIKQ